jgi:hypothetical protein
MRRDLKIPMSLESQELLFEGEGCAREWGWCQRTDMSILHWQQRGEGCIINSLTLTEIHQLR